MRTGCIYAFVDNNGRPFYIGLTTNLSRRIKTHMREMESGSKLLKYKKIRKLMKDGYSLKLITIEDNINIEMLHKREVYWIDLYKKLGFKLYNMTIGGDGVIGYNHTEKTKKIIGLCSKGKIWSDESRKKLRLSTTGCLNPMFGTKYSEEEKLLKSVDYKGRINIKKYIIIDPDGREHVANNGMTLFCEQHGLTQANMSKVANGERKMHKGWKVKCSIP